MRCEPVSPPLTKTIYVDKRVDDYIEDGSFSKPFKTIKTALEFRGEQSAAEVWGVRIGTGVYDEDNPITLPAGVTQISADGPYAVVISPNDPDEDLFATPADTVCIGGVSGVTLDGNGNNETAFKIDPGTTAQQFWRLSDIQISNFDKGLKVEEINAGAMLSSISMSEVKKGIHLDNDCTVQVEGLRISHQAPGGDYGVRAEDDTTCRMWDVTIDGTFDEGLLAEDSEIHAWGMRIDDADIGIRTRGGGEVKCWSCKINDPGTWSIVTEDADDQVILTGAELDQSKISQAAGSKVDIQGRYLSRQESSMLASQLIPLFTGDVEAMPREDDHPSLFVDFLADMSKIDDSNTIEVLGGELRLKSSTDITQYFDMDVIDIGTGLGEWREIYSTSEGEIYQDNIEFHEGTGSLKVDYTAWGLVQMAYGILYRLHETANWNGVSQLRFWVKTTVPNVQIGIRLLSGSVSSWFYYRTATDKWEEATFDISSAVRNAVTYVYFRFERQAVPYVCNLDDWRLVSNPVYVADGWMEGVTQEAPTQLDFFEMLAYVHAVEEPDTDISLELSLDGGAHWKTGLGVPLATDWWQTSAGGVLETADGGEAWSRLDRLRTRFMLRTTNSDVSPVLDDYFVIWRYNES